MYIRGEAELTDDAGKEGRMEYKGRCEMKRFFRVNV